MLFSRKLAVGDDEFSSTQMHWSYQRLRYLSLSACVISQSTARSTGVGVSVPVGPGTAFGAVGYGVGGVVGVDQAGDHRVVGADHLHVDGVPDRTGGSGTLPDADSGVAAEELHATAGVQLARSQYVR